MKFLINSAFLWLLFLLPAFMACDDSTEPQDEQSTSSLEEHHNQTIPQSQIQMKRGSFYNEESYHDYERIQFHSYVKSLNMSGKENKIKSLEELGKSIKKNPTGEQWFFIMLKYKFGYGTNKVESSATELMSCNQYSCDPEQLIKLKDQIAKQNLLAGQTLIDYQIIVIDGYYSYASDMRMKLVSGQ